MRPVSGRSSGTTGAALVVVLLAIAVLLPPTLVLATLAINWQRQSMDYRDVVSEEFAAHAAFEEARNRIAADGLGLAANEASSFAPKELGDFDATARVAREADVVLTREGGILRGAAAENSDLRLTAVDGEGRVVFQYRRLEIYVVQIDVARRPTLPEVRLYGVVSKLPDGTIQTLGLTMHRGFFAAMAEQEP